MKGGPADEKTLAMTTVRQKQQTKRGRPLWFCVALASHRYSSSLRLRWLTRTCTPSRASPCQFGHVFGHNDLYLGKKWQDWEREPWQTSSLQSKTKTAPHEPLQEDVVRAAVGKSGTAYAQVFHQTEILDLEVGRG